MQEKWMLYAKKADFKGIAQTYGIDQVLARVIRNRGVTELHEIGRYLNGSLEDCHSPFLLKDMEKAAALIQEALQTGRKIRILGDYDVDGVSATFILMTSLGRLGARVDCDIPERIRDGYGVNLRMVEDALTDGVEMIITCDNGISAAEPLRKAKEAGLTVIVTDHHEVPFVMEQTEEGEKKREVLPPADAIINPHQQACGYPEPGICGAVVALKLAQALYQTYHIPEEELSALLEAAALATVGDVMELKGENRILVKEGLKRMAHSKIPGLRALMEVNTLDPASIGSYHLGFVIGPCLNAGGRLETARKSLSLLLETDEEKARAKAWSLKNLNEQRKTMTEQGLRAAVSIIEETPLGKDDVYVVYLPDCHESIAGIVAGKIREAYQHPVFVITKAENGLKGSGRSIPGYPMFERLTECGKLLTAYGGHPMAAGLSLPENNLEPFRKALNANSRLKPEDFQKEVWIDAAMPISYVTEDLMAQMHKLEPFGNGNEKPVFAQRGLMISKKQLIGKNRNVLKMTLISSDGRSVPAILFREAQKADECLQEGQHLDVTYYPDLNEYMGRRTIQMTILSFRTAR